MTLINDILEHDKNGEVVERLEAIVTDVYEWHTGRKGKQSWSFQELRLEDDSGQVILKAWNRDDLSNLEGKVVLFKAGKGKEDNPIGFNIKDETYKGKTTRKLSFLQTAEYEVQKDAKPAANNEGKGNSGTAEGRGDKAWEKGDRSCREAALMAAIDYTARIAMPVGVKPNGYEVLHIANQFRKFIMDGEVPVNEKKNN